MVERQKRSENRQRTTLALARMTPSERARVIEAAQLEGMSLSEFLRTCALAEADRVLEASRPD
ncbi:Uncharacterized protein conserved in bacteria [Mycobacteroides abscessus subsp. abscessus]|uniref:plasmid mobilization protein n=1 Tax=Mycobacteroides abscessus TaxID=36809 RepID=UPI000929973D|nr:Uncharacterized protein conserved in bacteria [Mycobacteroides abscessus subsp. abscessus]